MAEQSKNKKTALIVTCVLAVLIIAAILIVVFRKPAATQQGKKTIVVEVINGEDKQEFTVHTDQEFLRGALEELNLIKGSESEYGLFVTEVNGVKVGAAGSLPDLVSEYKPGDTVQLKVIRDNAEMTINVTLEGYTEK